MFAGTWADDDVAEWNGTTWLPKQKSNRRTAVTTVSAVVAYANITGLTVPLKAATEYLFDLFLLYRTSAATNGAGFRLALTNPETNAFYAIDMFTTPTTRVGLITATAFGTAIAVQTAGPGAVDVAVYISGSCLTNAAGTLTAQVRSEAAVANGVTVGINSNMRVQQI
jgi:hypothetical protein